MDNLTLSRAINGSQFLFKATRTTNSLTLRCDSADRQLTPLCKAIETSWSYSPAKLLRAVLGRHGQSFEGVVSFAYHEDYPDELAPGVTASYLDDEVNVAESFFVGLVREFALSYFEAAQILGADVSHLAELKASFVSLNA
jgi:hypothetical protein